ncbi:MAG TPA: twin-arginine translocation signal domain-containing protein [Verrucomicrobiae bacterium]|nr:twin-arginine translocation signal domain-containing protein [Verrucomicrobiae bacterium]
MYISNQDKSNSEDSKISRRDFLKYVGATGAIIGLYFYLLKFWLKV